MKNLSNCHIEEVTANMFEHLDVYSIKLNYKRFEIVRYNSKITKGWLVGVFDTERRDYVNGSDGFLKNFLTAKSLFVKLLEKEKEKLFYQF